jgi:hypothetical protein
MYIYNVVYMYIYIQQVEVNRTPQKKNRHPNHLASRMTPLITGGEVVPLAQAYKLSLV